MKFEEIISLYKAIRAESPGWEPGEDARKLLQQTCKVDSFGALKGADAKMVRAGHEILRIAAENAGLLSEERPAALTAEPKQTATAPKPPTRTVAAPKPPALTWEADVREILADDPQFASAFIHAAKAHIATQNLRERDIEEHARRAALYRFIPGEHVYWSSFKGKIQSIVGYKGLIQVGHESGVVRDITAAHVYDGDEFVFESGRVVRHVSDPFSPPKGRALLGVWATIRLNNGGEQHATVRADELDALHNASTAKSPWRHHRAAMERKTAIRRAFSLVALPPRFAAALVDDEAAESAIVETSAAQAAALEI